MLGNSPAWRDPLAANAIEECAAEAGTVFMKRGWVRGVVVLRMGGAEGCRRGGEQEDASAVNSRNDKYDIKTDWLRK